MDLKKIADSTIPKADKQSSFYKDGNTGDIMHEVLEVYKATAHQLKAFAPHLNAGDVYNTCSMIWHFVKANIRYKIDPPGVQWVKTPARTWADKVCDCKSYSIFILAILKHLGIKGAFRFVSFSAADPQPTHVYVVVKHRGKEIILDCVLGSFDEEKPYTHKHDYNMSNIYRLSGIGNTTGMNLPVDNGAIDSGKLEAAILKERLELEKEMALRKGAVAGIGNVVNAYDHYIKQLDSYLAGPAVGSIFDRFSPVKKAMEAARAQQAAQPAPVAAPSATDRINHHVLTIEDKRRMYLDALRSGGINKNESAQGRDVIKSWNPPFHFIDIATQFEDLYPEVKAAKGLDNKFKLINPILAQNGINYVAKRQNPTFWQGVKNVAETVVKTAVKVVTFPISLAAKGILELTLPKAAPNFLYLFITDAAILAKLPEAMRRKREKQQKKADFIVNTIGMGRDHFMGIIRNGIMKHVGQSPENYLAEELRKAGIAGIGVAPFAAIGKVGAFLIDLIKKIGSIFGKKDDSGDEDIAPSADDLGEIERLGINLPELITTQPANKNFFEKALEAGGEIVNTIQQIAPELVKPRQNVAPDYRPPHHLTPDDNWREDGYVDENGVYHSALENVNIKYTIPPKEPPTQKDNTMLYVGLGVAALLLLKKK